MRRTMNPKSLTDAALGIAALCVAVAAVVYVRSARAGEHSDALDQTSRAVSHPEQYARFGHALGRPGAPVQLVVFSDVQCPYCRKLDKTLSELQLRHPEIGIVYRHFPSEFHYSAFAGAVAAECAGQQGRFADFIHLVFSKQDSIGLIPYAEFARRAGVSDSARFAHCSNDSTSRRPVQRDIAAGEALGLQGTPSVIIGDRLYDGAIPLDSLEAILQTQTKKGSE